MTKTLWHMFTALVLTLGFAEQSSAFDQPVSVAEVTTHPGFYEKNWVTIEGVVHDVRIESRWTHNSKDRRYYAVTWFVFELTDDSGTVTVQSLTKPQTGPTRIRGEVINGVVIVRGTGRISLP